MVSTVILYYNIHMRRLTMAYVLRNASLGNFVVVWTSQSVLTQTQIVYPTTHLGYTV